MYPLGFNQEKEINQHKVGLLNSSLLSSAFNLFKSRRPHPHDDDEDMESSEPIDRSHHPAFYHHHFQPPMHPPNIQLPNLKSKFFESPIAPSQIQYDCSAPIARNTPENNQVRVIDYRGNKIASFRVDGKELICLPQAFEVFLKNLVGGLHTVYTKLKRLDIVPVVCNVEQVRILRGLGAIQPGVNRCKLIAPTEFDTLYDDCTNSGSRPGRPPKRHPNQTSGDDSSSNNDHKEPANSRQTMNNSKLSRDEDDDPNDDEPDEDTDAPNQRLSIKMDHQTAPAVNPNTGFTSSLGSSSSSSASSTSSVSSASSPFSSYLSSLAHPSPFHHQLMTNPNLSDDPNRSKPIEEPANSLNAFLSKFNPALGVAPPLPNQFPYPMKPIINPGPYPIRPTGAFFDEGLFSPVTLKQQSSHLNAAAAAAFAFYSTLFNPSSAAANSAVGYLSGDPGRIHHSSEKTSACDCEYDDCSKKQQQQQTTQSKTDFSIKNNYKELHEKLAIDNLSITSNKPSSSIAQPKSKSTTNDNSSSMSAKSGSVSRHPLSVEYMIGRDDSQQPVVSNHLSGSIDCLKTSIMSMESEFQTNMQELKEKNHVLLRDLNHERSLRAKYHTRINNLSKLKRLLEYKLRVERSINQRRRRARNHFDFIENKRGETGRRGIARSRLINRSMEDN